MTNENVAATTTTATPKKSAKLVYPAVPTCYTKVTLQYITDYANDRENHTVTPAQMAAIGAAYDLVVEQNKDSKAAYVKAGNAAAKKFCEFFYPNLVAPKPKKVKKPTFSEFCKNFGAA